MNSIKLQFGDVTKKSIVTPNQFVSHMVEHIAWRLGVSALVIWKNEDWAELGMELGSQIKKFAPKQTQGVALGMIDDGSAEVVIDLSKKGLKLESVKNINLNWFLSARCEQLNSGKPLVDLLSGLCQGLKSRIEINICSFEDPHHTWEGVFRGVGMALNKIFTPKVILDISSIKQGQSIKQQNIDAGNLVVQKCSMSGATVYRKTAETQITVGVVFGGRQKNKISINVDKSINMKGLSNLISLITQRAGFGLNVDFQAEVLSSSHVVWEDVGLVLGRALLEVLKARMEKVGINGAGSNLSSIKDIKSKPISLGLSVEGRKFWQFFPVSADYQAVRKNLLIGKNILGNLRSEDLDDFIDGLSGGMGCSLLIVIKELSKPEDFWKAVFAGIGDALKEVFLPNPYRKGVPPGVKASLN